MSTGTLFVQDSRTGAKYEIPICSNAVQAIDLQRIRATTTHADRADQTSRGLRVYDPGLQNTAVMESAISFSDHERGLLIFRGYTLQQLWNKDFEDMFHLLLWGDLPTESQRAQLSRTLARYMDDVPCLVHTAIRALPRSTRSLPLLLTGLTAFLATMQDQMLPSSPSSRDPDGGRADELILRTVACYGVIFAITRCHRLGIPWRPPSVNQTFYENLFTMAALVDAKTGRADPVKLHCFRRFAMLNADHGMALVVFSTLVTASSQTDPISCLISTLPAAYGPLHFGATESAQNALREIGDPANIPQFLQRVKTGKTKLFGYGHREYKGVDPRVEPIREILKDLAPESNPLYKLAEAIETAAATDEYFVSRRLFPNADFYGNFVFTGIGFEPEMIPAAMLAHRIMGIMAHWREYTVTRGKLFRPTHIYTGNMSATADPAARM